MSYSVLQNDVNGLESQLKNVKGVRRILMVEAADAARDLQLATNNFKWIKNSDQLREELQRISEDLKESSSYFFEEASKINSKDYHETLTHNSMFWLEKETNSFRETKVTMIDLMEKISRNLQVLAGTNYITNTTTAFLNIYSNCVGESLKQINDTLIPYIKIKNEVSRQAIQSSIYIILPVASFFFFSFIVVITYHVYKKEKLRKNLWKCIENIALGNFTEGRRLATERIQGVHDPEFGYENQNKGNEKFKYKMHSHMKKLTLALGFLFLLEIGLMIGFYSEFYEIIKGKILEMPDKVNQGGMLLTDVKLVNFWTREAALEGSSQQFDHLMQGQRYFRPPSLQVQDSIRNLKYWKNFVLKTQFLELEDNTSMQDLVFKEGCVGVDCSLELKKGLYSAFTDYEIKMENVLSKVTKGKTYTELYEDFFSAQKLHLDIVESLDHYLNEFSQKTISDIETLFNLVVIAIVSITLFQILFYFLVLNILLSKNLEVIQTEMSFVQLIPGADHAAIFQKVFKTNLYKLY